jgi:small subunit ribosomal protein S9
MKSILRSGKRRTAIARAIIKEGYMGQADAVRTAIARALLAWVDSEKLRTKFMEYDRHMIVGDPRRREPKHFGGPGARAKYTKSYR